MVYNGVTELIHLVGGTMQRIVPKITQQFTAALISSYKVRKKDRFFLSKKKLFLRGHTCIGKVNRYFSYKVLLDFMFA